MFMDAVERAARLETLAYFDSMLADAALMGRDDASVKALAAETVRLRARFDKLDKAKSA